MVYVDHKLGKIVTKKFSLIELPVVIAILGILTSILLPALAYARKAGKTSISINNLRQIYARTIMYTDDNNIYFFLTNNNFDNDGNPSYDFCRLVYEEIQGQIFSPRPSDSKEEIKNSPYKDIMFCPIARDLRGPKTFHAEGRGDYSMNRYFSEYRTTGMLISGGKSEPLMVTGIQKRNSGSYAKLENTVYEANAGADYIYYKIKNSRSFLCR